MCVRRTSRLTYKIFYISHQVQCYVQGLVCDTDKLTRSGEDKRMKLFGTELPSSETGRQSCHRCGFTCFL